MRTDKAERHWQRDKAKHDRKKKCVWLDLTQDTDKRKSFMCQFCDKLKYEPKLRIETAKGE